MKQLILFLLCLSGSIANAQTQTEKLLVNKYWQYSNSIYREDNNHVYNFRAIPSVDSIKEIAMYFEKNGTFKEIVNKNHPKPARNGKWHMSKDTLVLDFPKQRWNYKILFMNNKEFQCTMSK